MWIPPLETLQIFVKYTVFVTSFVDSFFFPRPRDRTAQLISLFDGSRDAVRDKEMPLGVYMLEKMF